MTPRIDEIRIRNYKSLAQVSAHLQPFNILVGPNGAGKSNFVDALAFVQECLGGSIELAFKNRGGIGAVRRRSGGHPTHVAFSILMRLSEDVRAEYSFEIAAKQGERFSVAHERCTVLHSPVMAMEQEHVFEVKSGEFVQRIPGIRPKMTADRLALFAASATEEFRAVYDFLTSMRFYSIVPERLRELQEPDSGDSLNRDGSNAAAVLKRLREEGSGERYELLCGLLSQVVEGVDQVEYLQIGQKETLQFKQDVGLKHPWTFSSLNMSDGTLRVLGLLLAAFRHGNATLVAIEEPEATVHPLAAELIVQVLLNAAAERQVIITTHSPDLLDWKELVDEQIMGVKMERGTTYVAPIDEHGRKAIRDRLYTPGELLRSGELNPDIAAAKARAQGNLFGRRWDNSEPLA